MNQEYNLGVQLRKRYINLIFYQSIILIKVSIVVLSSHTNRTVVSAQSLLMDLYPAGTGPLLSEGNPAIKGRFQPIPIMTLSAGSRLIQFPYEQYLTVLKKYVSAAR